MIYVFGDYELDTYNYELRLEGTPLQIEPKVFDLLSYLIQHHDHLVSKETLHDHLWPDQYVSESALTYCVTAARKAVGDNGRSQGVIKTLYGRGYRFIAPVHERDSAVETPSGPDLPVDREALEADPADAMPTPNPVQTERSAAASEALPDRGLAPREPGLLAAERRQLTVMWCRVMVTDLLSEQLDPEELYEFIQEAYKLCVEVVHRFDGYIAQRFGDGLMVYFGYPRAHEDDAYRAVCTGLELVTEMRRLNARLEREQEVKLTIRVGIHTGMVVMEVADGEAQGGRLALGDPPHVVAQLPGFAEPNTVVISASTFRLVEELIAYHSLGDHLLEDLVQPLALYQVLQARDPQLYRNAAPAVSMPFVGREQEIGLLQERWAQVKDGMGQVVLLSGESGIGKSRLVQMPLEQIPEETYVTYECRCSPYHQNSALFPLIDYIQRRLQWHTIGSTQEKLATLQTTLEPYGFVLDEVGSFFASLFSLPLPDNKTSILTPERQKQNTLEVLLAWFLKETEQQPACFVIEDLHWADPSTLEFLTNLIDQIPTVRMLVLLTFRPDFQPPWPVRSHINHIALSRFTRQQVERMIQNLTQGKVLPNEVVQQLVAKSDGVPLFVEEMTRMVLETGLVKEVAGNYELTEPLPSLAIPSTLHDSLMARLDRLGTGKQVAQLGATLGREFSYALIQSVASMHESTLQQGLARLVDAELLHQRGFLPQAQYTFKHALIQDAAYQSLVPRTRRRYHAMAAQKLEELFPETRETQPELLAYHYTEAGLNAQAVAYRQQAAQQALNRSTHLDAIVHAQAGLEALATLPDSPERHQHELILQATLGVALTYTRGYSAPEVVAAFDRARELSEQIEDVPQLFTVLRGMWHICLMRSELPIAYELGEHLLRLARDCNDAGLLLEAHRAVGTSLFFLGQQADVMPHLEYGLTLYDAQHPRALTIQYGQDTDIIFWQYTAFNLWLRGYPQQATDATQQMLIRSQQRTHYHRSHALVMAAHVHQWRGEPHVVHEQVEACVALAQAHVFPSVLAIGEILQGWVLTQQERHHEGIKQIRRGIADYRAMGAEMSRTFFLALLTECYLQTGDIEAGHWTLNEAIAAVEKNGERWWASELYRLKAELLLQQTTPNVTQAESALNQALAVARDQSTKSLELRATMSLCSLWQQQGKRRQAHDLLEKIYSWFTEGHDTADLKKAKTLLDMLA